MSVQIITKENFEVEVLQKSKFVLLNFGASRSGPCRLLAPVVEEISNERTDIKVAKLM